MTAQEIATLRKEAQAFKAVRAALRTPATTEDAARMVFQKVRITFLLSPSSQPYLCPLKKGIQRGYPQPPLYGRHVAISGSTFAPRL